MNWLRGIGAAAAALFSPLLAAIAAAALAITDIAFALFGMRTPPRARSVNCDSASIVIPNWNGRDLLEKFLPSVVVALAGNLKNEIIVVDNASTDGSVELLRDRFPQVRVLAMERNLGFGGGSNAGIAAARNDVVVLLNNDMRVDPDFLAPLLAPFSDPLMFSVSCQIFFSDPHKRREETGLTETWWESGQVRVSHRIDPEIKSTFPCAYPGGGSSAFDRNKFLELGGFDHVFRPFYYEDTDLGALAWKRGWKLLYEPRSVVFHEHRGTIGKKFSPTYVDSVVKKNALLYCWKNIHHWRYLATHFPACCAAAFFAPLARTPQSRAAALGLAKAVFQIGDVMSARWRARQLSVLGDQEAFRRQQGGYYRDRFEVAGTFPRERLQVLFLSPYPIEPTTHGGAVFMKQTLAALAPIADVHLLSFLDNEQQIPAQEPLRRLCASAEFFVRKHWVRRDPSNPAPRVVREFWDREFAWASQRIQFCKKIDAVQIEYTMMAQYAGDYRSIPCFLFEHDLSYQSLQRRIQNGERKPGTLLAYMQVFHYELNALRRFTRVQVCSRENKRALLEYRPELTGRVDDNLRAAIDADRYQFVEEGRDEDTLLFAGSFNHAPNTQGLTWFLEHAFPSVLSQRPGAKLIVAGSGNLNRLRARFDHPAIEWKGFVPDMDAEFSRRSVLICPVLSGSGVRVKLLEAFASGIPVVSTHLGAEGLADTPGDLCEISDNPQEFAHLTAALLGNPERARALAKRARAYVVRERNASVCTGELERTYRSEVLRLRNVAEQQSTPSIQSQRSW